MTKMTDKFYSQIVSDPETCHAPWASARPPPGPSATAGALAREYTGGDQEDSQMNVPIPRHDAPASPPIPHLTLATLSNIAVLC